MAMCSKLPSPISKISNGGENICNDRCSNFELLRIIAMFLVLIIHADIYSLGFPTIEDINNAPSATILRFFIQSLAAPCVNLFILISGYFRIKLTYKKILSFVFLVLFWRIIVVILYEAYHFISSNSCLNWEAVLFNCVPIVNDWFVESYLVLMVFAPMLNSFIEIVSESQLCKTIFVIIILQICCNWIEPMIEEFDNGYSALSFFSLYILGAAIQKSKNKLGLVLRHPFVSYVGLILLSTIFVLTCLWVNPSNDTYLYGLMNRWCAYNGLFTMASSICLFVFFMKLRIKSQLINFIAASAFSVYLFHMNPLLRQSYRNICRAIFNNYSGLQYLAMIGCLIVGIFSLSVVFDQIRKCIWGYIEKYTSREPLLK